MVSLEKHLEENTWKDSHPIVITRNYRGIWAYSPDITRRLNNNDQEYLRMVFKAQTRGEAEVH